MMRGNHWVGRVLAVVLPLLIAQSARAQDGGDGRDIEAMAAALRGATILDTDKYRPVAVLDGCDVRDVPRAPPDHVPEPLAEALAAARRYSEAQQGVSLLVARDGRLLHESYTGEAGPETLTTSYSMMKTVTALGVGLAIERGLIDGVKTPVGDHLAGWADDPRGDIALERFLTMSSGLKLYSMAGGDRESQRLVLARDINAVAMEHPLVKDPGTVFRYNNADAQLAGAVAHEAVQDAGYAGFSAFLEDTLWCPLGNEEAHLWLDREGGSPHFAMGLHARGRDWLRIGELIRRRGRVGQTQVVPADWIDAMTAPSDANPRYGYLIWRGTPWSAERRYSPDNPLTVAHKDPYRADDVVFLDGFGGQRVYVVPSPGLTVVRTGFVNFQYDDSVIVNTLLAALEP